MQFSPQKHMDAMIVDRNCLVNTLMQPINVAMQFVMCIQLFLTYFYFHVVDYYSSEQQYASYIQYNIMLIYYFYQRNLNPLMTDC